MSAALTNTTTELLRSGEQGCHIGWSEHLRTLVVDSGGALGLGLGRARVGMAERTVDRD